MTYADKGYEIVPLFSPDEVERLRRAVAEHMDRTAAAMLKPLEETVPGAPFDERIERIAETDQSFAQLLATAVATDVQRDPAIAVLATDPRIADAAERLTGCPIEDRIVRMRLNSSALTKHRQAWHSDVAQVTGEGSTLIVTAWIPLTDAGPDTGGLEVVPGRRADPVIHGHGDSSFTIDPAALPDDRTVIPKVPAGHCLLMDRFTPHRAVENCSGRTRWSLVIWMKTNEAACMAMDKRVRRAA